MKDNTTAGRESVPRKLLRLLIPILALLGTILGGLPIGLEWLFAMLHRPFDLPMWVAVVGFSLTVAGLILAVVGFCIHKKVGAAGVVLSVIAIFNPLTFLTLFFGGLETSLLIFGM